MLPSPGFHHLHLNSIDRPAAIEFYTRRFPTSSRTTWGGFPAVHAQTNVLLLFTKVGSPPKTSPRRRSGISAGTSSTHARPWSTSRPSPIPRCSPSTRATTAVRFTSVATHGRVRRAHSDERMNRSLRPRRPMCSRRAKADSATSRVPMTLSWSMRAIVPLSASTTCTCIKKIRSAPSSGIRHTSTQPSTRAGVEPTRRTPAS